MDKSKSRIEKKCVVLKEVLVKLKDGLILRKVAGQFVVVPTGKRVREIPNTVYISSSAAYLWDYMKEHTFTKEKLADLILQEYTGVTRDVVEKDIEEFLGILKNNNILEPEPDDSAPRGGSVRVVVRDDTSK